MKRCAEKRLIFMAYNIFGNVLYLDNCGGGKFLNIISWEANLEELVFFAAQCPKFDMKNDHRANAFLDFIDMAPKKDQDGARKLMDYLRAVNRGLKRRLKKDGYDPETEIRTCEMRMTLRNRCISDNPFRHDLVIKSWMGPGIKPPPGTERYLGYLVIE